jgi:hypothetical protein
MEKLKLKIQIFGCTHTGDEKQFFICIYNSERIFRLESSNACHVMAYARGENTIVTDKNKSS